MQYVARDTTLSMYGNPIMWSGNQQILGDTIRLFFNDSTIDWAHVINSAFAAQWKEGPYYDQMSGNEMKSFFEGGEMRRIETSGNVLTIFFPQEEDSTLIGMFNADASFLNIFLKDNKMDKMIMRRRNFIKKTGLMVAAATLPGMIASAKNAETAEKQVKLKRSMPLDDSWDVIVVGGGPAG